MAMNTVRNGIMCGIAVPFASNRVALNSWTEHGCARTIEMHTELLSMRSLNRRFTAGLCENTVIYNYIMHFVNTIKINGHGSNRR